VTPEEIAEIRRDREIAYPCLHDDWVNEVDKLRDQRAKLLAHIDAITPKQTT